MRISVSEVESLVQTALESAGASPDSAGDTASGIVYAETSGITSHGLVRVPYLMEQLHSGKINGRVAPSIVRRGAATLVDAGHGLGYRASRMAVSEIERALATEPIAFAAVSRSHHFGIAGWYAESLALRGHVGFVCSGTVGAIAPAGGKRALLGNGPMAVAAPRAEGAPPVVVDFAPAVAARGNIAAAAREGRPIPEGWALDGQGRPTTDPESALRGTLVAAGGTKGIIVAMAIDILIASLTVSRLPGEASSVFSPDGDPPELGHLFIGFNPALLDAPDGRADVDRYLHALSADGMRIPGDRRREKREEARKNGIAVSQELLDRLRLE